MSELKILAVDTSSAAAGVALWEDGFLLGEYYLNTQLTHSQTVMEMASHLLKQSKTDVKSIDCFACAAGPGSFTGLRIGIAAVKGMAYGANKPCVAVSTLEGLANNLIGFDGYICPVMDARCNQVYTATFKCENNNITRIFNDSAIAIDELCEKLLTLGDEKIYFVGDGAKLCMDKLSSKLKNARICPSQLMYSRGSSVARIGEKMFLENKTVSAAMLNPTYLRLSQAEREMKQKREMQNENKN